MKKIFIVCSILLLAAILRFWQLGVVPPSPDWDEAALGYNAYSLLKTGKDEYGTRWPLTLRSYDDYKPPLYAYLAIPAVKILGLSTYAVRVPAAIMGTLGVLGVYFLSTALLFEFKRNKNKQLIEAGEYIPFVVMFLLAISPWHLQFSRIAFEANIGVTLNIWGLYFLLRSLRNSVWMPIAAGILGLGFYAYHSERVFLPLLMLLIVVLYWKEFFVKWKIVLVSLVIGIIVVGPLVPVVFGKDGLTRLKGTSTLSDQTGLLSRSVSKLEEDIKMGDSLGVIWENRRLVYIKTVAEGYLSHFSIKWLFLTGDNDRHHAPDVGLIYFWELPLLLLGMIVVAKQDGTLRKILFGWLLIAPIAASPTSETPHAIRTLVTLPVIQIFTAFGIFGAYSFVKESMKNAHSTKRFILITGVAMYTLFIAGVTMYYFHIYYGHTNTEYSQFWQYGYKQTVEYTELHKSKYKKIVVSTKLEQPHMFYLFFLKYDPATYLKEGGTASGGFAEIRNKFDVYEFRPIHWAKEVHDGSILYVGTPREILTEPIERISYLDGFEAIRIAE